VWELGQWIVGRLRYIEIYKELKVCAASVLSGYWGVMWIERIRYREETMVQWRAAVVEWCARRAVGRAQRRTKGARPAGGRSRHSRGLVQHGAPEAVRSNLAFFQPTSDLAQFSIR